jgi:predicted Zn-dependent protease with MMP-like domain
MSLLFCPNRPILLQIPAKRHECPIDESPPASAEDADILGLYEGIPLTERNADYFGVMPDLITLYKSNIEDEAEDADDVKEVVRVTVLHEIAHHFGIDDDRLDELGWA